MPAPDGREGVCKASAPVLGPATCSLGCLWEGLRYLAAPSPPAGLGRIRLGGEEGATEKGALPQHYRQDLWWKIEADFESEIGITHSIPSQN